MNQGRRLSSSGGAFPGAPGSSNGVGSSAAFGLNPTVSPTNTKLAMHSPYASVFIRIRDQQYLVPLSEVLSYHSLFQMVQKLNTKQTIFEGEYAFRVHIDEPSGAGAIVLERFWDKVVRDGLKISIEYNVGSNLPKLPIDKSLQAGMSKKKDADDSFYPHVQ